MYLRLAESGSLCNASSCYQVALGKPTTEFLRKGGRVFGSPHATSISYFA